MCPSLRSLDLCTKMKRHNSLRKKNWLSNLYVGKANYNLDNHVVLRLRSRGDGSTWAHRSRIHVLVEVTASWGCESRSDDFHLPFQVKRPASLGLSGVSSKRHCLVETAMPPVAWICCFLRKSPAAMDEGPLGRRKPKCGLYSQRRDISEIHWLVVSTHTRLCMRKSLVTPCSEKNILDSQYERET